MNQEKFEKLLNAPIFYITNDPERALGLESRLPNFHIVCTDHNPTVDALLIENKRVFSLAGELGEEKPIFRNSNKLLQHSATQAYIEEHTKEGETPNIMVFKVAPNIERTCEKLGYNLLNTSALLNRTFENKIPQYKELSKAGINFPKTIISKLKDVDWGELSETLGTEIVIQFDRGHTGLGTFFLNSEQELQKLIQKFPNREVRIASKIEGEAWTINAAVTRHGIAMSGLSYQITGIQGITDQKGGTVGNDWSKVNMLTIEALTAIEQETRNIGKTMQDKGYKGLFGIDFIITPTGEVVVIEINARQPASTGMHTKLMLRENQIPLMLLHIAEFLFEDSEMYDSYIEKVIGYKPSPATISSQNSEGLKGTTASQVIARKLKEPEVSKYSQIQAGIYDNNGEWRTRGYSIEQISNNGTLLVLRQFNNELIKPGYEIIRFQGLMPYEQLLDEVDQILEKMK